MDLQKWFDQGVSSGVSTYSNDECVFLIYKGFKISKLHKGGFKIENTRLNDFYSKLTKEEELFLTKNDFFKGCDILTYNRNKKRYYKYVKSLERLYKSRDEYNNNYESNVKFYQKRLRNCEDSIIDFVNELFLTKARILQHEIKYNINPKFLKDE